MRPQFMTLFISACLVFPTKDSFAAKYSVSGEGPAASRNFSADRDAKEKPPLPREASQMPQKDLEAVAPISFDELRLFVRDWRKYSKWLKSDGRQYKAVAYLGVSEKTDYPSDVIKWMDTHGWATDRFFLLERKIRMTLSVQQQEEKRNNLVGHLERQIEALRNNTKISQEERKKLQDQYYKNINEVRNATDGKAPVTPEEYNLIKLNKEALEKVLSD